MSKKGTILVVDDERGVRESFRMALKDDYYTLLAGTGEEAISILTKNTVDLILLDIRLPDVDGLDLLVRLKEVDSDAEVIMVTAVKELKTAVKAIKLGAYEYVIKPFVIDEVLALIDRALEKRDLVREVTYLRTELQRYEPFEKMVGKTKAMKDIFSLISTISEDDGAVLIQGESGTGKELVARAIHNRSSRAKQPFVVVNCAAIPKTLMESEVFGHHKGAFTNATRTTSGKLEIAGNGTIFLDDIDTLDIGMQAKLLRVIQEKEFERLGSTKTIRVNARFVAASNKDLEEMIARGQFRDDLYYRLNVFPIKLPPLRDRRGDIPLLLSHFMNLYAKRTGKPLKRFSKRIVEIIMEGDWPGNVRELQNLVERLATTSKSMVIDLNDIPNFNIRKKEMPNMTLREAMNNFEIQFISETLARVDGVKVKAAERLGVHRNTLLHKMKGLGIK